MEKCEVCGQTIDDFEICTHEGGASKIGRRLISPFSGNTKASDFEFTDTRKNFLVPLTLAVAFSLGLDALLPVWSNLPIAVVLTLLGTMLANSIWAASQTRSSFNFVNFLKSLPHSIFTPKLLQLHFPHVNSRKIYSSSIAAVLISFLAVLSIGSPGNSSALKSKIHHKVKSTTGISPNVRCPTFFIATPGSVIDCSVGVGFGIHVPARVTIENFFGNTSWSISPF